MYAPFVIHFCIWSQTDNFDFDGLRWPSRYRACGHAPVVPSLIQNYLRISGPHAKDRFLFPCTCLNSVEGNFCIRDFLCRPRTVLRSIYNRCYPSNRDKLSQRGTEVPV